MDTNLKALCVLLIFKMVTATYYHALSYVQIQPPEPHNKTDFGFSMAYHAEKKLLVIGAPHHDLNGRIFSVSLDNVFSQKTITSSLVDIDIEKVASHYNRTYTGDLHFCLGASVAVTSDYLLSCAPLWTSIIKEEYGAYGSCFISDINNISLTTRELLEEKQRRARYGGAGWNIVVQDNDIFITMSPEREKRYIGYLNTNKSLSDQSIQFLDIFPGIETSNIPYKNIGGAITFGKFFSNDVIYAFTGQTQANLFRTVGFMRLEKKENKLVLIEELKQYPALTDRKVGSMFGAALCAADLNLDGFTDLLVGAPARSCAEYNDCGALHIYIGGTKEHMNDRWWIILMNKIGVRFGTSIAATDLDGDNIKEIFVSGPYEDSGLGAVYILSGSEIKDMLEKNKESSQIPLSTLQRTQRIQNEEFKAFGYTLKILPDLDKNGYDELAIGAKNSGKVLLYRSVTPVHVNVTCSTMIEYVPELAKSFSVIVVVTVARSRDEPLKVEGNIALTVTLAVDGDGAALNETEYEIKINASNPVDTREVIVTLSNNEPGLYQLTAAVKSDIEDYMKDPGHTQPPPLTDKLRLYHVEMNPYGHRVLLILEAKKAKYEVCKLDPLHLPEWFRVKNPRLKIPVLEIPTDQGDKFLFESVVICDYLDEKYGRTPLHSRDPYVKAQDRLLIERFNELIKGSLECFDTNFAFGSEQIVQTLDIFERELAARGTNYYGGSRPGMLDYMIWPWVERLYLLRCVNERKFDEKRSLFPNFADWGDQMQLDEVVKKHSNSPAEYFDYYKNARAHSMGYYL